MNISINLPEKLRKKKGLVKIITLEMGKPYREALEEVAGVLKDLYYYINRVLQVVEEEIVFKTKSREEKVVFEPWASLE